MVKIDHKIIITGMLCLTIIYISMLITGKDDATMSSIIVGIIALCLGVLVPYPKIDNRKGVLVW